MLSERLRPWSADLAAAFVDVPVPTALATIDRRAIRDEMLPDVHAPDLGEEDTRVAILAGPHALLDVEGVHAIATHLGAPVANTWGAKGIFAWDDPHHMGTCGLQRDDFALLGFDAFDLVLAIGVVDAESPLERFRLTGVITASPGRLDELRETSTSRPFRPEPNELHTRIATIAQPGYVDDSVPRHPARAVMDLKESLAPQARVTAQPGAAGLWVARTFPTDRIGSVVVPAYDRPGIGAAVGLVSAAQGTDTVCAVATPADDVTRAVMEVAARHELPLRLVVWDDDHVDWTRTEELIAAAGPVVAWSS